MTPVVDGLCLLFSFLSISEAMMCQQYRVNLEVDNKVSQQAPSENLYDVSFATCSRSCIKGCECFSFNTQSNKCRLYMYSSSCDPSNMTVSEAGWRSYIIYETKPPGRTLVYLVFISVYHKCAIISTYFLNTLILIKQSVQSLFISF